MSYYSILTVSHLKNPPIFCVKLTHASLLFCTISGPSSAKPGYQVTWLATQIPPALRSSPVVATAMLTSIKIIETTISVQPVIFLILVRSGAIKPYVIKLAWDRK